MRFEGKHTETIEVLEINNSSLNELNSSKPSELSLLWFKSDLNQLTVDGETYTPERNELISFTEFHEIKAQRIESAVLIRWNRAFYCVVDHDSEVGCKGILYYGATQVPLIKPSAEELEILETVYKMFLIEMKSNDNLQLSMLQMMLKRFLILCLRIYKKQVSTSSLSKNTVDIIREYNFLVEQHFRTKHSVKDYADMLYKSPKTLSNIFKKYGDTSPLQFIQNRIMLEARRLLFYSDQTISEISYGLGFPDIQSFSRFFKKQEGISPQKFKEREELTISKAI
ncbi:helix-turn-helix domain-containing protein [Jiulongibacter sp. NS-SX5]|uniref:helix-turn-helix domain-containing protein n=1 Tax=Jiulongibacter sp. NS-SX5 TaxID=3463854 RepID=UPI00405A03BD